ncbi:hypothetical protein XA68_16667 [Ophiocordyceps unilateralis]|uniref:Heterokaryon incompatibility domain-containing protein n=1 Tax=Ophiocordyceps unilateralis TaxID=268505 RepID=A0A2A9PPE5_OPHUN|nr:hypothetical protein XA68_16667 [Ophiocordyceps unilateralis]
MTFHPPITRRAVAYLSQSLDVVARMDQASDQLTETSNKQEIFRNAFIGIAALGSTSSSSGLFSIRDPALMAPTVFDLPVDAAGTTLPPDGCKRAFQVDPLSRNVRAVQERLLVPRMVHFGRSMIFWDWRAWPDVVRQVFADWFIILETYTGCALTSAEEKLLGLAGIAQDMKSLLREHHVGKTSHVTGLWEAMLPGGLLWNMRGRGRRPSVYRAPSWSWGAVEGTINFHDRTPEEASQGLLCKLARAATTPRGVDETGEVMEGTIFLRGKLAVGKVHFGKTALIKSLREEDGGTKL